MGNALDKARARTFVYSKDESGKVINKIVYKEDAQEAYDNGWFDSPVSLVNLKETEIDASDAEMVQLVGESIQGVTDSINDGLNLDLMKTYELAEYAKKHFDVVIKVGGRKKEDITAEVKNLING